MAGASKPGSTSACILMTCDLLCCRESCSANGARRSYEIKRGWLKSSEESRWACGWRRHDLMDAKWSLTKCWVTAECVITGAKWRLYLLLKGSGWSGASVCVRWWMRMQREKDEAWNRMWMKDREVLGGQRWGVGVWDRDGETASGDRIRVRARDWPTRKTADVCLPKLCCGLNLHSLSHSQVSVYGEHLFSSAVRRVKVKMSRGYSCNFWFFGLLSSIPVDQSIKTVFIEHF